MTAQRVVTTSRARGHLEILLAALVLALVVSAYAGTSGAAESAAKKRSIALGSSQRYPVGGPSTSEPSGEAPPGANALPGYRQIYVQDFVRPTLPKLWDIFTGIPTPGGHFWISHVRFRGGLMELLTYRNPRWGDRWVTGGICECGTSQVYGAYFVRSRITGPGPNEVELLWPLTNKWPPEIDFNETGDKVTGTTSSVHFGVHDTIVRRSVRVDMRRWHTWGVIWTARSITYTVDGRVWGTFNQRKNIPRVRMTLDFEQVTQCPANRDCPTAEENMYVDWSAEYAR